MKKLLISFGAVLAGIAIWVISTYIVAFILSILGSIPFIGSLLFYPSDTQWVATITTNSVPVFFGCFPAHWAAAKFDCRKAPKAYGIVMLIFAVISAFGGTLLGAIIGGISAVICMSE